MKGLHREKEAILALERKLGRRLLTKRRELNQRILSGGRRSSSRKTCNRRTDPWCMNRRKYMEETSNVVVKQTPHMGKGLFAARNIKKDEVVIRMEEPVSTSKQANRMLPELIPWKHVRINGNQGMRISTYAGFGLGKVVGTISINNEKDCTTIEALYENDPHFVNSTTGCVAPLPDDAAINTGEGNVVYYDNTFTDIKHVPLWYRINHKPSRTKTNTRKKRNRQFANTEVHADGRSVTWKATSNIKKGSQIFFDYGVTPPEWN